MLPTVAVAVVPELHIPPVVRSLSIVVEPAHTKAGPLIAAGLGFTVSTRVVAHPVGKEQLITTVPAETPDTIPVAEPIVAMPGSPELHSPTAGTADKTVVVPTHRLESPIIPPGRGLTVTIAVVAHPVGSAYVMFAVPAEIPETSPALPAVAVPVEPELHVPPAVISLSVVTDAAQTTNAPVIAAGDAFTVSVSVLKQPAGNVYVITEVPAAIPETIPDEDPIVATPIDPDVQLPPVGMSDKLIVVPVQTLVAPETAAGCGFTVMTIEVAHPVASV